jgi:hypothetical protein
MQLRFLTCAIGFASLLAACGGGGGTPSPPATSTTPTVAPSTSATTNASGVVVIDDSNGTGTAGSPLAGVRVVLMPWSACGPTPAPASTTPENDGCPTPLPSPQATTNASGQFTLNGAPNGKYLLVIGADTVATPPAAYAPSACTASCPAQTAAPFTVQATVHDTVTLTGGNQTLKAPTLPQYAGVTYPTWETNGDYRLATLNATTEMPCYIGWQYERAQNGLAGASVDEWLAENTRALIEATANRDTITQTLSGSYGFTAQGAPDCAEGLIDAGYAVGPYQGTTANSYVTDSRAIWVSGAGYPILTLLGGTAPNPVGSFGFLIDPRSSASLDPNWPQPQN